MVNELDLLDPFRPMRKMRRNLFDLFAFPNEFSGLREPLVDVVDKGKELLLTAELPGIDKKDIDVSIDEDSLAIRAESRQEKKEEREQEGYYFHERAYQGFFRKIPLPSEVVAGKIKAEFKDGILTVNLPKKHPLVKGKGVKVEIK